MKKKFKALSIAICCFVIALWSETQGMENSPDTLESAKVNRTTSMQSSFQDNIDDLACESTSSQLIKLKENSTISWSSYLLSPGKFVIQSAYEIINFTTHHPRKALIIGLFVATHITAAAAQCPPCTPCKCYAWGRSCNPGYQGTDYLGLASGVYECAMTCNFTKQRFCGCV